MSFLWNANDMANKYSYDEICYIIEYLNKSTIYNFSMICNSGHWEIRADKKKVFQ